MACAASAGARRASHAAGRVGAGEFAGVFGRGDAGYAGYLRARSTLHRDGGARAQALADVRAEVEATISSSQWRAVDGFGAWRCVRARLGGNAATGED